jgi:hypothetical protein
VADREAEENARLHKEMMRELNQNPLIKRKFLHNASTSNSVQVIWSHPEELNGQIKKSLNYELQYGVGSKVNKVE